MIDDWDVQNTFPTSTAKRQRHDEPGDALDVEPPAKISRTSLQLTRHHKEECTTPGPPGATQQDLEKDVVESAKHNNSMCSFIQWKVIRQLNLFELSPLENP